jgi:hypothetical protein
MYRGRWYHRPWRQLVDKRGTRVNQLDPKKIEEDELVRGTIWMLSPVMSWMFIVFHSPVVSGVHPI